MNYTKVCTKCQIEYIDIFDSFYKDNSKKDGLRPICKICTNDQQKSYRSKPENKQKIIDRGKRWTNNNLQKSKNIKRKYYERNKDKVKAKAREFEKNNPEKRKLSYQKHKRKRFDYAKNKYHNDPLFKLSEMIRSYSKRITKAVKEKKNLKTLEYLGCSLERFKLHIESQFQEEMTWENHGINGWHIDHIIPVKFFIENSKNPWEANHYTNLRPLWAIDNIIKSDRMPDV